MDKGELIDEINLLTAQIYKEMLGKGPRRDRSTISNDILIIRIERDNNTISRHLRGNDKGREALKSVGRKLFESFEKDAKRRYEEVIKQGVKEIHYDAQKLDGEIVLTIIVEANIL